MLLQPLGVSGEAGFVSLGEQRLRHNVARGLLAAHHVGQDGILLSVVRKSFEASLDRWHRTALDDGSLDQLFSFGDGVSLLRFDSVRFAKELLVGLAYLTYLLTYLIAN